MRTTHFKKLMFIVLTVVLVIAFMELIGFIILKLNDHDKGIDSSTVHRLSKYRHYELNPDYRGRWEKYGQKKGPQPHSKRGFRRDSSISIKKPTNVIRVFYMGGSQLYGAEASTESGYPSHRGLLNTEGIDKVSENILNEKLKDSKYSFKVEVINAGVIGYHSFQHLFYLMEKIYLYSPDFIVHLDGHNDFYNTNSTYNHLLDYKGVFDAEVIDYLNNRDFTYATYIMVRSLSSFSYFLSTLEKFMHKSLGMGLAETIDKEILEKQNTLLQATKSPMSHPTIAFDNLQDYYSIYAHNTFIRTYKLIQTLEKHHGFKTLVFLQPEIVFEKSSNLGKKDTALREKTIEINKSYNYFETGNVDNLKVRMAMRKMLPNLFQLYGIPFYDIAEIASPKEDKKQLYVDYTHLTVEGARRVGIKMATQLFPHILLKLKSNPEKSN